ncbi:MAG: hypothetical protein MI685_07825 [Chlorobiales bacterium]|nr:hypothetical protein [Chlorobiales bacterium]
MSDLVNVNFQHSPSAYRALISRSSSAGIMGPVGSGKSHGCSSWILAHAELQKIQEDGYKKSRYAVIRNTGPELKSTTIKTFEGIFPAGPHGRPIYSAPITYRLKFPPRGSYHGIDCEVIFLALDNVNDIRKLLSLELTGAFVNEAREVVAPVIDALIGRIGRYPSMAQGGCVSPQVIADTNAPDEDSWWYDRFENNNMPQKFVTPDGREIDLSNTLFRQPPAVLELKEISGNRFESVEPHYNYIYEQAEIIEACNKFWGVNPEAENLPNLDPAYYARQLIGSNLKYIQVMLQAKYGFFQIGKPVVPEFNHDLQVQDIPILKDQPLLLGLDIGGGTLQPAAVIGQRHERGNWLIHSECIGADMGVENFARVLAQHLHEKYPGMEVEVLYLDPASEKRDELFENKIVEYLRAKPYHFPTRSAPTNDWRVRRQAIADPCTRLIDGRSGLLISKRGCPKLINGLKGKWDFKKLQTSGVEAFAEYPSKNEYSHPCDALGYLLCGGGEAQPVKQSRTPQQRKAFSNGFSATQSFNL